MDLSEELKQKALPAKEQRRLTPAQTTALPVIRNHRRWLAKSIDSLITKAWDPSLAEDELRALNDLINTTVRERGEWDSRLVELGGVLEVDASHPGLNSEYMYFGRAKALLQPGAGDTPSEPRDEETKYSHLYQNVDAEYYGYNTPPVYDVEPVIEDPVVPTTAEIESALLQAKKRALLERLA